MYLEFFNLGKSPFRQPPDLEFYFPVKQYESASAYLAYSILNSEGIVLLVGEDGVGKSLLIQKLMAQFDYASVVARVFQTQLDDTGLLRAILVEFGQKAFGLDKVELLDQLNSFLIDSYVNSVQPVIIIDDAQHLDVRALIELRLLLGLETDKVAIPQIVLVGTRALEDKLQLPELSSLNSYIHLRKHLVPLGLEETSDYIRFRLAVAGGAEREIFLADAIESIHAHTKGIPRKINILCDTAMMCAFADECREINAGLIDTALLELGWKTNDPEKSGAHNSMASLLYR